MTWAPGSRRPEGRDGPRRWAATVGWKAPELEPGSSCCATSPRSFAGRLLGAGRAARWPAPPATRRDSDNLKAAPPRERGRPHGAVVDHDLAFFWRPDDLVPLGVARFHTAGGPATTASGGEAQGRIGACMSSPGSCPIRADRVGTRAGAGEPNRNTAPASPARHAHLPGLASVQSRITPTERPRGRARAGRGGQLRQDAVKMRSSPPRRPATPVRAGCAGRLSTRERRALRAL